MAAGTAANPLTGQMAESGASSPAFGDLDVIARNDAGTFQTFLVPEPAQELLLGRLPAGA